MPPSPAATPRIPTDQIAVASLRAQGLRQLGDLVPGDRFHVALPVSPEAVGFTGAVGRV
jgi:hypothetical protein